MVSKSNVVSVPVAEKIIPEVSANGKRRRYTKEYKLKIIHEAAKLKDSNAIGAMLRREGLYHSYLTVWRRDYAQFGEEGLSQKKRGAKVKADKGMRKENERLMRANARLEKQLHRAETIIEIQKKVASLLGIPLQSIEDEESNS